ncbi:hypothetical protein E2I00_020072, partial [Balaenoptera physalus]
ACRAWLTMRASQCSGDVEFTSMETYLQGGGGSCAVSVSSRLGRMAHVAGPPYCITRFGVEAFSDCLRYEVHPLGGKVGVVEPGNFIATTSLCGAERIQAIASKMVAKMETYCNSGSTDTSPVISAVIHTLTSGYPLHSLPPHGLLLL